MHRVPVVAVTAAAALALAGCADGGRGRARAAGTANAPKASTVGACPGDGAPQAPRPATATPPCAQVKTDAEEIAQAERDPNLPIAPARAAVGLACQRARIACPTLLPASSELGPRVRDFSTGHAALLSVMDPAAREAPSGRPLGAAHLLLGQTPQALALGGRPGARWPASGLAGQVYASIEGLRIAPGVQTVPIRGGGRFVTARPPTIIAVATVRGRRALVLRADPYPQGGIHGDHVLVVWNASGRGHLVSLHYDGAPLESRVRAALAAAASEAPASTTAPPRHSPVRSTPSSVARAILAQAGPPAATSASCRAATPAEGRGPFGHTRLPLFHCVIALQHRQAVFTVQILPSGCFVAERQPPGRAIYGCERSA